MDENTKLRRTVIDEPAKNSDGFLDGFFFNLHPAFLAALDISLQPRSDRAKTKALKESARKNGKSEDEVSRIRHQEMVWTQGNPPSYAFKPGDFIHTKDGEFSVQVTQGVSGFSGMLRFSLYKKTEKLGEFGMTQAAFVQILTTGEDAASSIQLASNHVAQTAIAD
ncbi:MAG: hypothetical protein KAX70_00560 [Pseudomonas sp.]|nr:hypothetical protein [Pseudomonas sp.]